jgi:hypothetical protein
VASSCSSGSKCCSANSAPPSFPRHWLRTQRDLNHRGDGQNALRGSMEVGSSSDRGGLAYWVHVLAPRTDQLPNFARCFPAWIAGFWQFQRTIRAEEAVAASALGRMPARCPAVGGSLWM